MEATQKEGGTAGLMEILYSNRGDAAIDIENELDRKDTDMEGFLIGYSPTSESITFQSSSDSFRQYKPRSSPISSQIDIIIKNGVNYSFCKDYYEKYKIDSDTRGMTIHPTSIS